jgi:type II secretory pathway pseudopilin PulG
MRTQRPRRSAFTITEMLVATALILFIMAIISQVFASASKTYSALRVAGDMQERLRTSTSIMRRDLASEHFDGPYILGRSGPRLGDQRLDLAGWMPPQYGYFEIRQVGENGIITTPVLFEPLANPVNDGEGIPSTRATSHIVRFTVKLGDLPAAELFCTEAPNFVANNAQTNSFQTGQPVCYTRWAEVLYFLWPNGDVSTASANGPSLTLYSLRRRVRQLAPQTTGILNLYQSQTLAQQDVARYPGLALMAVPAPAAGQPNQYGIIMLGPDAVTNPNNRVGAPLAGPVQKLNANNVMYETGDDILLTDVLSFEIKAAWFDNQLFNAFAPGSSPQSTPLALGNMEAPLDNIPVSTLYNPPMQRLFDTFYRFGDVDWDKASTTGQGFLSSSSNFAVQQQVPLRVNIRTIQLKVRVYDRKAEQARQVTMIQEM